MLDSSDSQLDFAFDSKQSPRLESFIEELVNFRRIDRVTEVHSVDDLDYFVNDYWTSSQRQSNSLHEISYRACFKAELPEFFIERLTDPGGTVYDPFSGRGTTALQAALMRRQPVANDINPLSKILLLPRLSPPTLKEVGGRLDEINWSFADDIDEGLLTFFHQQTLNEIYALRAYLNNKTETDNVDDWIRMVAINRLTGHSSGFFSVYTLPPNQAVSIERQKKINEKRQQTPPLRDVKAIILKKSRSLLRQFKTIGAVSPIVGSAPSHKTDYITSDSVDLVVTSPPFLDIVQYAQDNWLRCWFAGINAEKVPISMHKTVESWTEFTRDTLKELCRVVKPGGHIAYEVGEVRNGKILLEQFVAEAAKNLPLEILGVMVNEQNFTKTANCWGVKNNNKGTNSNRIVVMKRR